VLLVLVDVVVVEPVELVVGRSEIEATLPLTALAPPSGVTLVR
jgi:hypothetical protein